MKGIRKLFLGLVFMTLFGVGLKVDVKAYNYVPPDIEVKEDNGKVSWILTLLANDDGDNSFPLNEGETYTYWYHLDGALEGSDNIELKLYMKIRSGERVYYYSVNNNEKYGRQSKFQQPLLEMEKAKVKEQLEPKLPTEASIRSFNFTITPTGSDPENLPASTFSSREVKAYRVNMISPIPDGPEVTYEPTDGFLYLLPNEETTIIAKSKVIGKTVEADGEQSVYRWAGSWDMDQNNIKPPVPQSSDAEESKVKVTMGDNPQGATNIWPKIGTVTMKFRDDITTAVELKPGSDLPQREIYVIGTGCDAYASKDATVTVNGVEVKNLMWSGGAFSFTVNPETPPKDISELLIKMNDKNAFRRSLKVTGPKTVTVKASPESSGTVVVNNVTKSTGGGSTVVAENNDEISIRATASGDNSFVKWDVSPASAVSFDTGSASASFKMGSDSVILTANFSSPTGIKTVKVTKGTTVKLSRFTDSEETAVSSVKASSDQVVDVSGSGTKAKDYTIRGLKTTSSSGTKGLIVDGSSVDVVVYKTPDLYVDTSSTSSTLVVDMPSSVYHDRNGSFINWDNVKKAAIFFSGNKGEKGWVYSKLTLDWQEMSNRIKEVSSDSEDTVVITAHPVNPDDTSDVDELVSDSESIKVYKIKLDGSEGAKYTVNGKDVGDYFYAIEGMEYEVKSSAKTSGEKIKKWEHDEDKKDETYKFTAEKSRTLKAYYSNSSSSSSSSSSSRSSSSSSSSGRTTASGGSGGANGAYDDVPKTGESKTDIWILWSVLFVSILGAGFMIWKRFGLVRAIAAADREEAEAVEKEIIKEQKKEKEEKMQMLKDLRNL